MLSHHSRQQARHIHIQIEITNINNLLTIFKLHKQKPTACSKPVMFPVPAHASLASKKEDSLMEGVVVVITGQFKVFHSNKKIKMSYLLLIKYILFDLKTKITIFCPTIS